PPLKEDRYRLYGVSTPILGLRRVVDGPGQAHHMARCLYGVTAQALLQCLVDSPHLLAVRNPAGKLEICVRANVGNSSCPDNNAGREATLLRYALCPFEVSLRVMVRP